VASQKQYSDDHVWGSTVTGQFADKPTRGQQVRGLVNMRSGQFAD